MQQEKSNEEDANMRQYSVPEGGRAHVITNGDEIVCMPHVLQFLGQEGNRAYPIPINVSV
jgi:hypothetical protein